MLAEPRRPWPDLDRLKSRFLEWSAELHPDRHHEGSLAERAAATQRYMELSAAYHCLSDPKERLQHLLELESGSKPAEIQPISDDLMTVGMEVGQLCGQVDRFLAETSTAPLLQVRRFQQAQQWTEQLLSLQERLLTRRGQIWLELERMNELWDQAPPVNSVDRANALPLRELEQDFRLLSYLGRWLSQLQQRITQLAL